MRALWAGQDHVRLAWRGGGRRQQAHLDALVSHKLQTGAPVFSAAGVARSRSGAEPTWRGCNSTLTRAPALQWRCHSTGTAGAADRDDNCECWHHTPRASCHRLLAAAPGPEATALLDSAASHQAGEQSPAPRSTPSSTRWPSWVDHSQRRVQMRSDTWQPARSGKWQQRTR